MVDYDGKFYLGRPYNLKKGKTEAEPLLYDPDDLTTHGVVVGMTGSGKTGLCIDFLEEAALNGIPAIMIDPKGDIANLLLHFPDLAPEDFQPWIDPDEARREEQTVEEMSAKIAAIWEGGLKEWGIGPERIEAVRNAVEYAVYTPGSDAGIPVSILASLKAPQTPWEENKEASRERISSTVTALLGLVGIESDPVRSREHILLSNLFENAWKAGQDMDITELIHQIQSPPLDKLGAFEIDQFFPEDDRFELAMMLNNLLGSPSFEAWIHGTALDVGQLLWTEDGKPRHSVFYLAHLPESERMFFTTLLLTEVESWMRAQPGSSSLRAILYFDEVFGYMPPVANPPSKPPLLRLLKTARAFGLGVLLTTQNPVDLDYKALSNAGTWFVGKLQTEQDKSRLLDGLESVDAGKSGFKRSEVDKLISSLDKRVFLLNNVHEREQQIFKTRWAMAYLRGPITRAKLREINILVGAHKPPISTSTRDALTAEVKADRGGAVKEASGTTARRPRVPTGISEFFLPNTITSSQALKEEMQDPENSEVIGLMYKPALLAQADVRYLDRKINLDHVESVAAIAQEVDPKGFIRWDDWRIPPLEPASFDSGPSPEAQFAPLEAPLKDAKSLKTIETDFQDYIFHGAGLKVPSNPALKLFAAPGISEAEFQRQCSEAADEAADVEVNTLEKKYETKIKRIKDRLAKEHRELAVDEAELGSRKMEEVATLAENVFGLFSGSRSTRRISTSLTKRRMTSKAKADLEESQDVIDDFMKELENLQAELTQEIDDIQERWNQVALDVEETVLAPYKKNIRVLLFGVAWTPYWRVKVGDRALELPGYGQGT
ncbi:MAG TPA: DUF87 domain-containing protein [Anaerolineales bacterium]|nr:DUF87 domain-containing protein [Anaerolineales bacterium]